MLDLKWIRENVDRVREGVKAKGVSIDFEILLDLDAKRRSRIREVEELKAKRNLANDEISKLKQSGKPPTDLIDQIKTTSQNIKEIDADVGGLTDKIDQILYTIPNIPHDSVAIAKGTSGNKVVRTWGEVKSHNPYLKDHLEIMTALGWLSMDKGSKITGTAFPFYQGFGARLERALINFMVDFHTKRNGYTEVWPPALVNRASMTGTGQLPKLEEDMYRLEKDDLFLIPTAEVPITNLLRDEIVKEEDLPIRYVGYSPCFRREAGSYGKDTRGLSRVHQFDKVELVKFVKPENSLEELELLVGNAESILQALELPYRVLLLGSGDMSFASSKCYDLEVWAPATQKWFEVSSCSTFGDFQARRANIRFRRKETNKPEYVHTLNGSGVAFARAVLCLIENFQTPEGKVNFPKVLLPYLS
ncbi:MAG: serine--tRNA ligase [Candidatus Omnitrophica bacterium]|nr:serine--tRNA ligase [Candidatus Omnitrophota bacterium]MDD5670699.1 serine--tRNA ligase [Candidatus Omnitrophota bacterium]